MLMRTVRSPRSSSARYTSSRTKSPPGTARSDTSHTLVMPSALRSAKNCAMPAFVSSSLNASMVGMSAVAAVSWMMPVSSPFSSFW